MTYDQLPELPDDLKFDFDNLDAELGHFLNPPTIEFDQAPTDEEWKLVNNYRWGIEQYYEAIKPEDKSQFDQQTAHFTHEIRQQGLHLDSLRALHTICLTQAINYFFMMRSMTSCESGPIVVQHMIYHTIMGQLVFDYVIREALIRCGAPAPEAPASGKTPFNIE